MENIVEPFDTMEWREDLKKAVFVKSNKEDFFVRKILNNELLLLLLLLIED